MDRSAPSQKSRAILRDAHLIAAKGQPVQGEAVTHFSLRVFGYISCQGCCCADVSLPNP